METDTRQQSLRRARGRLLDYGQYEDGIAREAGKKEDSRHDEMEESRLGDAKVKPGAEPQPGLQP